jgi:hypothetical protein
LLGVALALGVSAGCAARWDEMVSHERDWSYVFGIGKPHPLTVILETTAGDRRAQALCELHEPLRHGGNAKDQDTYLKVLQESAAGDPEPLCRLTAIRCLGKYKDPRAARILEDVYQQPKLPFTLENNSLIRKEALVGLEKMHNDESRHLLIRVARQPGPPLDASHDDRNQTQDEKIVAIRALGKYKQQECVDALTYVMRTEKDIALRDRALASLEESTGKRWPAQREAWLSDNVQPVESSDGIMQRVTGWK